MHNVHEPQKWIFKITMTTLQEKEGKTNVCLFHINLRTLFKLHRHNSTFTYAYNSKRVRQMRSVLT